MAEPVLCRHGLTILGVVPWMAMFAAALCRAAGDERPATPLAEAVSHARAAAQGPAADIAQVAGLMEQIAPVEADWLLQDLGAELIVWLRQPTSAMQERLVSRVLDELGAQAGTYRAELASLRAAKAAADDPRWLDLYGRSARARRAARLAPLAARWPRMIFAKHHVMGGSHYAYTEALSDAQGERTFIPGSALCLLEFRQGEPFVRTLLRDDRGVIRDPDVSYDARYILFAWKKSDRQDDYHLYEMPAPDGDRADEPRQITFGAGFADYEGVYLPNGDIIFNSTRCVQTTDCFTTEVSNLYTCDRNGRYLRRLGFDQVSTNYPTVLNDGRVVYTRWEYNDRGQVFVQGLMQMNWDGTGQAAFYGMNSWFPTTLLHARAVPGSHKLVAIASGHHTRQTGKLCIVDNQLGQEENSGVQLIAPVRHTPAERIDAWGQEGELFQYPYPLSEKQFLVCYSPFGWKRKPARFGIYLMDIDGRRELLAWDAGNSCNRPVPLAPRPVPPVRASPVDYRRTTGTYYMQDVYAGQGLAGIPRGTVRKLRVIALEYRAAMVGSNNNSGPAGAAMIATPIAVGNGAWDVKAVLGDARIHEDGSAFFEVPARTPVYFQALDEKGRMVQSMRSWSTLMPGENAACVGCHEPLKTTPLSRRDTYALTAGPQKLEPFHGPPRGFSFPREVQPVLDRHCIRCHDNRSAVRRGTRALPLALDPSAATVVSPLEAVWRYTTTRPAGRWMQTDFDDSTWRSGKAGFGARGTPGGRINTVWDSDDIWMRRAFELGRSSRGRAFAIWCSHDEAVEVYINGILACRREGHTTAPVAIRPAARAEEALKEGVNTLAVHCRQTAGGQFIDAALLMLPGAGAIALGGEVKPFSLLGIETEDRPARRRWSDAYLALTGAYVGAGAARGEPDAVVNWIHAQSAPPVEPPYSAGSARSGLIRMLEEGHNGVQLTREELDKIACWIDLAVPYCGDYTEANAWSAAERRHYERLLAKRRAQEEAEKQAILDYIRDRQASPVAADSAR